MNEQLIKHLENIFGISSHQAAIFLGAFQPVQLKKHDVFVAPGQVCHKVGLIETGLMKCSYLVQGDEKIFEFAYENSFISDYYSFVTTTPSEKEIRCLEDTVVQVATRASLEALANQHTFVADMSRKVNERLFTTLHQRLKSLLLDSPQQRYQKLVTERPDLAQRLPQYLLAAYLNVTPETVSRIRNKLRAS